MEISVETTQGLERRMTVTMPNDRIESEVDKKVTSYSKKVKLDGFRPGKVPLRVVKQRYGSSIRNEVVDEVIRTSFMEAIKQENLHLVAEPKIEAVQGQVDGFSYAAIFEIYPEIILPEFDQITIEKPVVNITEENIQNMILDLRNQKKTWVSVAREARNGDQVIIDFEGSIDGEPFAGGKGEDVPLELDSGSMINGFEEGLVGAKANEERMLDLDFPEDYRAQELAGKSTQFKIKVKIVNEIALPEVDAAFIKAYGVESGNEDEFNDEIKANMIRELKSSMKRRIKNDVLDSLYNLCNIEVPSSLINEDIERLINDEIKKMPPGIKSQNLELKREMFEEKAKKRVTLGLMMTELMKKSQIQLDQSKVDETIREMAEGYDDPEALISYYNDNKEHKQMIEAVVLEDQIIDWVIDHASVSEVDKTFDDMMKLKNGQ